MEHTLDRLAEAIAVGMPRRDILKGIVGASVGAVAAGFGAGNTLRAFASTPPIAGKTMPAVSLLVRIPSGNTPILTLGDRLVGRVSYNGEQVSLVPHISTRTRTVQLSVYRGTKSAATLVKRISLPLHGKRQLDAKLTELHLGFLQPMAVAALAHNDIPLVAAAAADDDCTVHCCDGGEHSAQAVCCKAGDPSCGSCCDAGHCPACLPEGEGD